MSYKQLRFLYVCFAALILLCGIANAQNYGSEAEVKKQAEKLFEEDQYAKAMPLYSQLLSLYPKDPVYNYKYGVCILFAGADKEKPIAFLEFASKRTDLVDNDVFYYLGRAYHVNYRFGDAIGSYNTFKKKASSKSLAKLNVERQIEMCNNGLELLKNVKDLVVMQKKDLSLEEYFRAYDLGLINSKLIVKPDDFKTSTDKKKKEESVLVTSPEATDIYVSSYGENDKKGKEIFRIKKLPNGEFSKPQNLGTTINTQYDEDYPYFSINNSTLYFCSKGHNSIGGYDVFKSVYDEGAQEWSDPVNLDFPISSPDDDLLYIPDTANEVAYFSSRRGSVDGNIGVYKIKVGHLPVTTALIKGKFYTTDDEGVHPKAKITVKNASNNKLVGVFNSNEKTGGYIVNVPSGAKYMFTVESDGFTAQSGLVDIPEQKEIRPLKQKLNLKKEDGRDKLNIYNNFDDFTMDEETFMAGIDLIKEKANLEVNYSEELENSLVKEGNENNSSASNSNSDTEEEPVNKQADNTAANNQNAATSNTKDGSIGKNLTNEELVKMANNDAKDAQREADAAKDQSDEAFTYANIKNEESQRKVKEAEEIRNSAKSISDPMQKQREEDRAVILEKDSKQSAQQAVVAYNLAKDIEADADRKQKEANDADKYAKELDAAVKSDSKESILKLSEQQAALEKEPANQQGSVVDNASANLKQQADAKRKEAEKDNRKATELDNQVKDMDIEAANISKDAEKTKDQQVKDAMLNQLAELNDDKQQRKKQSDALKNDASRLNREADDLQQQSDLISQVVTNLNNTPDNASQDLAQADKQKLGQQIAAYEQQNKSEGGTQLAANTDKQNSGNANQEKGNVAADNTAQNNSGQDKVSNTNTSNENAGDVATVYANKMADTEKIPNEIDRERAKAQVNKQWADALDKDIAALNDKLAATTDKKEKTAIKSEIDKLKNEQNEKRADALQSLATSNRLVLEKEEKEEDGQVADNQEKQNNTGNTNQNTESKAVNNNDQNTGNVTENKTNNADNTANTGKENNSGDENKEVIDPKDYNANYQKQLDESNFSSRSDLEREKKAAFINARWAESIAEEAKGLETQMKETKDKTEKAELKTKINELEKGQKEKEKLAEVSSKKVKALEKEGKNKEENLATDYNTNYTKQLDEADAITNETEKENKKIATNEQWISDIDKDIAQQNQLLEKTKKKKDKELITQKIANLETQKEERKSDIEESRNTLLDLKRNDAIAQKEMAEKTISKGNTVYALPEANEQAMIAEQQFREAKDYKKQSDSLKLAAQNSKVPQEKFDMYNQSQALARQAQVRNTKANETLSNANGLQYKNNATAISELAKVKGSGDEASRAAVVNTEAEYYFNEAAKLKATAANTQDEAEKEKMLNRAADYEKTALSKQANAYDIYRSSSDEELVASNQQPSNKNADVANVVKDADQKTGNQQNTDNKTEPKNGGSDTKQTVADNQNSQDTKQGNTDTNTKQQDNNTANNSNTAVDNGAANNSGNTNTSGSGKPLNKEEYETVINTTDYKSYAALKNDAQRSRQESEKQQKQADIFKGQAETDKQSSRELLAFASTTGDSAKGAEALRKSQQYDESARNNRQKSDSTTALALAAAKDAQGKNEDAEQFLNQLDKPLAEKIKQADSKNEQTLLAANDSNDPNKGSNTNTESNKTGGDNSVKENNAATGIEGNAVAATANKENSSGNENSASNSRNESSNKANASESKNTSAVGNGNEETNNSSAVLSTAQVVNENNELTREVVFEKKSKPAYSRKNPIPINDKLPKGLVFKVQIGAFRNPIPQELFKDFAPVMGETTTSGITRYTAGLFKTFESANSVRREINGIGYKDAFVVAYCNGTRININEAQAMVKEGRDCNGAVAAGNQVAQNTGNTNANNSTSNSNTNTNNGVENSNTGEPVTSNQGEVVLKSNTDASKGEAPAVTFEQVKGLVFTVQVGVYAKPVKPAQLFNIQPLYFEQTSNGYYRYSSGIFNSEAIANTAKNKVVDYGVKDAFVTAYYNGKRIPVAEARKLIEQNGNGIFGNYSTMNREPSTNNSNAKIVGFNNGINTGNPSNPPQPPVNKPDTAKPNEKPVEKPIEKPIQPENTDTANTPVKKITDVVYKVQIGEFKSEVPNNIAAIYFQLEDGVDHYKTEKGTTVYTSGSYTDFASADKSKGDMVDKGLKDAFVIAYKSGVLISLDEAKKITGE